SPRTLPAVNSNTSRPMPGANTGSRFLNWTSDNVMFLLQMERRVDHWLRPPFDATLSDPIARLTTALINRQRKDEGLKIAEEKLLPNEEESLDSIISSFTAQMRGLWKPGGFERGGNTKTHGIVRGEFIVHENLTPQFQRGIYAKPQTFRCWVRFSREKARRCSTRSGRKRRRKLRFRGFLFDRRTIICAMRWSRR